jgi:hypothetical protein
MNLIFSKRINCVGQCSVPNTTLCILPSHPATLNIFVIIPPTPPENLFLLKPWTVSQNLKHCISRGMYGKTFWTSVKLATYKPFLCNASHQPKQGHTRNQFDVKICQTKHSLVQQMMLWVPTRNLVYSFKEENLRL